MKLMTKREPDFLTVRALAHRAGISASTVRHLADTGVLKAYRLDDGPRTNRIFKPNQIYRVAQHYIERGRGPRLLPKS